MARRMIECKTWKSYQVGQLDYRQRCLWIGLITSADDQGRGYAHPGIVRGAIFPYDDLTIEDLQADINALSELGLIILYKGSGGVPLYQVAKWWDYQRPTWAWPSELPAPDGWADREKYRRGNDVIENNWDGDGGLNAALSDPTVTPPQPHDGPIVNQAPNDRDSGSGNDSGKIPNGAGKQPRPPAINVFRTNAHRFPARSWWDDIDTEVGRAPPDLELWGHIVKAYVGNGWNPTNVRNMLEFYKKREIPQPGGKPAKKTTAQQWEDIDRWAEKMAQSSDNLPAS